MPIKRNPDKAPAPRPVPTRREAFLAAYLGPARLNATKAAEMAGYAFPHVEGNRLLRDPVIAKQVNEALGELAMRPAEVIGRLTNLARSSAEDMISFRIIEQEKEDGTKVQNEYAVIDLVKARDRGLLECIAEVRQTQYGIAVKLYNKMDALDKLARVLRLYGDQGTVMQNEFIVNIGSVEEMERARKALRERPVLEADIVAGELE